MAGSEFARWWANRLPYYVKVYQETLVGIGVIGCIYYTFYYDGKKAVKPKADTEQRPGTDTPVAKGIFD